MTELILVFAIGFIAGALVMYGIANRAIDEAFDEWERKNR